MPKTTYDVRVEPHVLIPMRDGVRLSAHLTRPVAEGAFPAVIEYSPYRKGVYSEPPARFRRLAEQGYVVVQYDVRGTGDSEGFTTDVYQDPERQDGYDVVEWVAAQPWCDGSVGMWGISYCGVVCWQVAAQAPPHLKAIIVRSGTDDVYTEWTNPGGLPRPYMYENYAPLMTAYNLAPPSRELVGERWAQMWQERLENSVPWGIGFIEHLTDGPYWRQRSVRPDYDRVKCAVFVIGGWADWYYHPLLRAFSALSVPKRALIGPWSHMWPEDAIPGPRIDGVHECLRFFDHWLKGIDTGLLDEPPVTLFIREYREPSVVYTEDVGSFRYEDNWPPARAQAMRLHLGDGDLVSEAPCEEQSDSLKYDPTVGVAAGKHGGGAFPPWGMPLDQRSDETRSLCYTSRALRQDLEVVGVPQATLHVRSTAGVVGFVVKLCDVAPDGTSSLVTRGYLNATHRGSHERPEALVPGEAYELGIELLACAYRFAAGHRIRLDITCADFQNAWPTPERCTVTVLRGGAHASYLVLPVTPASETDLPRPDLLPSPYPLPTLHELSRPQYTVTSDLANDTVTVGYVTGSGAGVNRSRFTVSRAEPAKAVVDSGYRMEISQFGEEIVIETHTLTSSDALAFYHQVEAQIKVNGREHYRKSWQVSVPRGLA